MRLEHKTVIVTGGAGSLGSAIVERFAEEGATVAFIDRAGGDGAALESGLRAAGHDVSFIQSDITSTEAWDSIVDRVPFDRIDILVNNAGLASMLGTDVFDVEMWDRIMGVNLTAPFFAIRRILPLMLEQGSGTIVNISSIAAMVAVDPGHPAYSASKGGLAAMSRWVAAKYGGAGIRANTVYPGVMPAMRSADGELGANRITGSSAAREAATALVSLGRTAETSEVAAAVLFLASDESSYVTGADLVVDGGVSAR